MPDEVKHILNMNDQRTLFEYLLRLADSDA